VKRTTVSGLMALSLTVVLLGATASSASAFTLLDPTSADFGDRQVGTTSPPQAFTLGVGADCFDFPIIGEICFPASLAPAPSVTGDFAQTSDCPPLMFSNSSTPSTCTINATFTPTSTGPKSGTLTGATGLTAPLTGNGVTVPTPPTPPTPGPPPAPPTTGTPQAGQPALQLDLAAKKQELKKKLTFFATCNVDCALGVGGSVKQTETKLAGGVKTKIRAKLKPKTFKQLAQKLDSTGKAKAKIEGAATSPTSGTATDSIKVKLKD
jgi:hypothetical protein